MPLFACSAILFDLDGVLIDSTRSVTRQWRIWAGDRGIDPARVLEIAHGRRTVETVRLLAPHLCAEDETRMLEQREAADTEGVTVMPGAAELLRQIPVGRWCVVTSGTRYLATSRLRLGDLPIPSVLVAAEDVERGKPDPEPYLKGAKLLGIKTDDCLVIEDAPAGIAAAHAGGMKVVALPSTYAAAELWEADAIVRGLGEISVTQSDGHLHIRVP